MAYHRLVHYLSELADPRHAKGIRPVQLSSVTMMVMAMLCGRTSLKGIARFARTHVQALAEVIPLPRDKAPSYSTLQRLSQQLSSEGLCRQFNRWMPQYAQAETIAMDGKRITRTFPPKEGEKQRVTSLVSFFSHPRQLICGVGKLDNDKPSEIDVVQALIGTLRIERSVVTLDALPCQKKRWPRLLPRATATSSPSKAINRRSLSASRGRRRMQRRRPGVGAKAAMVMIPVVGAHAGRPRRR